MARGRDAAEARGPGAGQKAHQHGLGLVVPGVPERDDRPPAARQPEQKAEAQLAGELLDRRARGARAGVKGAPRPRWKRRPRRRASGRDGGGVALGLRARAAGG